MNKYYSFYSKGSLSTLAASPLIFIDAIKRNDWTKNGGRFIDNQLRFGDYPKDLHFPVEFIVTDGKIIRDVVEMRSLSFLISDRVKDIFIKNNLTGWQVYDVVINKKDGTKLPGFNGFSVIGRNPVEKVSNNVDIPDFFRLRSDKNWIICTQRVVDVLKDNNIKDFRTILLFEGNDVYQEVLNNINFPK